MLCLNWSFNYIVLQMTSYTLEPPVYILDQRAPVAPSRGPQIQGGSPPPPTTSRGAEWKRNKGRKKQTQQVKVKDQARHPQEKHIAFNTGRMRYRGPDARSPKECFLDTRSSAWHHFNYSCDNLLLAAVYLPRNSGRREKILPKHEVRLLIQQSSEETEQSYEETEQSYEETEQSSEETEQSYEETEQSYEETEQSYEETEQSYEETEQSYEETEQTSEETEQSPDQGPVSR
ncbi:unnamed protein product [Gadus morhua 'NCC']